MSSTQVTLRAKFFAGRGVETQPVLVDRDGTVRVWDPIACHYTMVHSMGRGAKARARKLAREKREARNRKNLVRRMSVFVSASGSQYVVVATGMPQDPIRVGVGDTLREAYDALETTALQSTHSVRDALNWAYGAAGWIDHPSCYEEDEDAELFDEDEGVSQ